MAGSSGAGAAAAAAANLNAVRETMDVLLEISRILNTGLDMETLSICVRLCEQGINPEALSSVIKELRKATEALKKTREIWTQMHKENSMGRHGHRGEKAV
ncbi:mitotic-spindle organizing protein 1 isoform X1 [Camelus dromedarius]|uniref:mitotic-spindle organizing protein 1 isoform X1 n=1 Tax=Camelus dromedarius TaxID=9838 RepID=UPI00311A4578